MDIIEKLITQNKLNLVNDVENIEQFIEKYYRADKMLFGKESVINSHKKYFSVHKHDLISSHDSNTGETVWFK